MADRERAGDPAGTGSAPWSPWPRHRLVALYAAVAVAAVIGVAIGRQDRERSEPEPALTQQLAEARRLADAGQPAEAIDLYTQVLAEDPDNTEALAYGGWLIRLAGRSSDDRAAVDNGLASIERALAIDSTYADAHFFRGVILYQDKGDPDAAVEAFRACLAGNPPTAMVPHVEELLARATAAAGRPGP